MKKLSKVILAATVTLGIFSVSTSANAALTKPIGSTFLKSALIGTDYKVQDSTGKTVSAKITKAVSLAKYNKNFSYANVSFVDYDKVDSKWVKYTKTAKAYWFTPVKDGITFDEFKAVKKGMTYNQAVSITGQSMKLDSTYISDGITEKDYSWTYDTDNGGSYVSMDFENNKLTYKHFSMSEY